MGIKGACPLGLPPPLGERGGHHRNFHGSVKNSDGISQSHFFIKIALVFPYPAFFRATPEGIDCQSRIEEAPAGRMGIIQDPSVVQEPWRS
jgi:hypothetical protein